MKNELIESMVETTQMLWKAGHDVGYDEGYRQGVLVGLDRAKALFDKTILDKEGKNDH